MAFIIVSDLTGKLGPQSVLDLQSGKSRLAIEGRTIKDGVAAIVRLLKEGKESEIDRFLFVGLLLTLSHYVKRNFDSPSKIPPEPSAAEAAGFLREIFDALAPKIPGRRRSRAQFEIAQFLHLMDVMTPRIPGAPRTSGEFDAWLALKVARARREAAKNSKTVEINSFDAFRRDLLPSALECCDDQYEAAILIRKLFQMGEEILKGARSATERGIRRYLGLTYRERRRLRRPSPTDGYLR